MSDTFRLFTKILLAELEDLENDIEHWGAFLDEKHKAEKITEYVFLQNSALLGQELAGVRKILEEINHETAPEELCGNGDVASIRDYYLSFVKKEATQYQFKKAIESFLVRKIEKVCDYFKE